MKKISLFLMLLSGACSPGWSHEAPIPINHIQWVVDAGRLQVHFHSGAPWWVTYVFEDQTPPPINWPDILKQKTTQYFDQHFILRADGRILPSHLVSYRYSEEVWRYYLGSQMDLEFSYTLPASVQTISGEATFYKEDNEGWHETDLRIDGAPALSAVLTLAHPEFSFPFDAIVRSPTRRRMDAGLEGLRVWETMPWIVLALAAFQLQLRTRVKHLLYYGGLIGTAAAIAFGLNTHRALSGAYGVGVFVFLMGVALAVEAALWEYRRRLVRGSESQAQALFTSQIRFVALLLGGMTLLLISHYFQKPT